ncbi:Dolichyl-phosphate-mannose-protein mannosyltransferase 4 [Smittium culicis]|uniref:Dolichyl-phosphate-mannose--protein mannosyltransferase n=1 Tax=Smittium culicis TaxID=133412 RepID=A0A1R1Y5S5_9FUNG|nr:Dolichyl-phosphate-mannose-protein mannosyltransferase 4 [Smittium culicis]
MREADESIGLHNRKDRSSSKQSYRIIDSNSLDDSTDTKIHENIEIKQNTSSSIFKNNYALLGFVTICFLSIFIRLYKVWSPGQVVFDEVHFGKFASYYLRREYYFDVHPPLAKMMLALPAKLVGYNGKFLFEKIGMDYTDNGAPYFVMRVMVAIFGSTIPMFVYMIMAESGYSLLVTFMTAFMVTFDNALVLHSRLILLDSFMLFFIIGSLYSYIRFFKLRYQAFSTQWYTWLFTTGLFLGCAFSCKLVGLFTYVSVGVLVIIDLWNILDIKRDNSIRICVRHFSTRFVALIIFPVLLYLSFFYIHFAILNKTGSGDNYHTPKFQMQLAGNRLTINTIPIYYGDAISFKHVGTDVYINGRLERFPRKYKDKRISSNGHQVTGISALGNSSYWTIAPVELPDEYMKLFNETGQVVDSSALNGISLSHLQVRNHDLVRLIHYDTKKAMRTHDVASPFTPTNMEFTMIDYNNTSEYEDTLFYLDIDQPLEKKHGPDGELLEDEHRTTSKRIRIISKPHGVAALTHGKKLPDWGFGDQEINGSKNPKVTGTLWTIDSVLGKTEGSESEKKIEIPYFSFFSKFIELQQVMLKQNAALTKPHPFQSTPETWPLMIRGVSFWINNKLGQQIYFIGNPFGWYIGFFGFLALLGIYLIISGCHQRNVSLISYLKERHLTRSGMMIVTFYLMHYLPFFSMGRSLFIHHYLPALIFKYMALGVLIQFIFIDDYSKFAMFSPIYTRANLSIVPKSRKAIFVISSIIFMQFITFYYFSPFVYGTALETSDVLARTWLKSWDFFVPK